MSNTQLDITSIKRKSFETLEGNASNPINVFLVIIIISNVLAVILSSVKEINVRFSDFFRVFELFSVMVFSIEYAVRIWSCTAEERYSRPILGRLEYALQPIVIVDLLAILPFYLPFMMKIDLRFLRILRIFRVLRVLKLERYFVALRTVARVLKRKSAEIASTFIVMFILLVLASAIMHYIEPQTFANIPRAMWWGIVTLTTVGYGDIYPQTALGQLLGAVLALLGIGLFGLPAGILAAGFVEEIHSKQDKKEVDRGKQGGDESGT
jgi:voltage-gated potassium channel